MVHHEQFARTGILSVSGGSSARGGGSSVDGVGKQNGEHRLVPTCAKKYGASVGF